MQPPDQADAAIFFGDGSCDLKVPRTTNVLVRPDIKRYTYEFEHTYGAASPPGRPYVVSFIGENRNRGVLNMSLSDQQTFYISTTVTIDPALLQNRSPVLRYPAIDNGAVNEVFQHNPDAFDADGDSLGYELVNSQQANAAIAASTCTPAPASVPGFVFPNAVGSGVQVPFTGPPAWEPGGKAAIFKIDQRGQLVWNAPAVAGEYNFAIAIYEYRRTVVSGRRFYRLISTIIRDLQVTVRASNNKRPELVIPPDLCVVAGTPVVGNVTATDPDGQRITLSASSGVLPPATFVQSSFGPPTATGAFNWTPDCNNIASDPTQVVFSAVDDPGVNTSAQLTDIRTWRIRVIGPAPQNLRVAPVIGVSNARNARLTWNSYICRKPGARVLIYRRENSNGGDFGECVTGIPASSGYVQIASLTYTGTTDIVDYTDTNGGQGLERGKTYCYRIYVDFPRPAGGESLASQEACVEFPGSPLLMRNVTVDRTAPTNGQITVRWTKPTSTPPYPEPLQYRLFRAVGTSPFAPVALINNGDTTRYVDKDPALDTQNRTYSYKVELLSQNLVAETSASASSVRLDGTAVEAINPNEQNAIDLRWTYTVPWDNSRRPTIIYRKGENPNDPFVRIATVTGTTTGGSYRDQGTAAQRLLKGRTYCYYVETNGTYNAPTLPDSLVNLSQQQCIAVRNVPCAPVLRLQQANCDSLASRLFDLPATPLSGPVYANALSWQLSTTPADCSRAIAAYNLYYAPAGQDSLRFLTTVPGTQTSYVHRNLLSEAGCYAVQAVDSSGTRSALSNRACKEDCQLFLLPNIFTPNGDGKNDTFRPKVFTPLRRTHFTVFNRWGVKIYESSADPLINWSGGGSRSEGGASPSVVEGVYYYQAEVEFGDVANTKRTYKGWVQITR
ncbi:gliding motility-associated C-terminal domain-containing protein [Hymenobacter sp. YC55]|uniref:T9SS type B sorting domain-containing protein n=1 Tax=Hymenobacter sp. YC55 TaxID=3034019 RepID=UPI0023F71402|nr:gliding motility-associated C-terminal domain-containing protein [Hymenobacter sp. YC55]MDF7810566.1 gliding motility-associated C-terminal domain-containing protein [Hymenobacter sp. YC55]